MPGTCIVTLGSNSFEYTSVAHFHTPIYYEYYEYVRSLTHYHAELYHRCRQFVFYSESYPPKKNHTNACMILGVGYLGRLDQLNLL